MLDLNSNAYKGAQTDWGVLYRALGYMTPLVGYIILMELGKVYLQ